MCSSPGEGRKDKGDVGAVEIPGVVRSASTSLSFGSACEGDNGAAEPGMTNGECLCNDAGDDDDNA